MINFRYKVLQKLGEGGGGEVFLVEDSCRRGQQLAMKILHSAQEVGAESDHAFLNEVSALVNLSHPNLVRIFDSGTVRHTDEPHFEQRRFFTMEMVRGSDALQSVASVHDQEEKKLLLESLFLQACSVLSHVHQAGIVHFDIKPENFVLVKSFGTGFPVLKLTDFGFSRRSDDTAEVSARGTLEYTAPEILRGEQFDHRVDLYSLGATFFHLLEGRCPFEAQTPVELAKRILGEEASFSGKEMAGLRSVISSLMEKDPSRRFGLAEDAATRLASGLPNGDETLESYFGYARKPKFVGRKEEFNTLRRAIRSIGGGAEQFENSTIAVAGLEGIGKTTLLKEVVKYARSRDLQVYEVDAVQPDVPFSGIASFLDELTADIQSVSQLGRDIFQKYDRIIGLTNGDAMIELWGGKTKESMIEWMSRLLIESADILPMIICVDNAQHLDETSAAILKITARDVGSGKLLLLTAETAQKATVFSPPQAFPIELRELNVAEVSEMSVSLLSKEEFAKEVAPNMFDLYGGTPGVLVEAFNAVRNLLPRDTIASGWESADFIRSLEAKLPRSIDDILLSRLDKLNRERQLVLSVLACFQYPAPREIVEGALPFHPQRMSEHLRFLQLDEFITATDNGLSIRMKRLKDAIYERLRDERTDLHALIGSLLERDTKVAGDFTRLQETAFQFASSGSDGKAHEYFVKAADEGMKLFAFQRSLNLFRQAVTSAELAGNSGGKHRATLKLVTALFRAGSYRDAIQMGKEIAHGTRTSVPERTQVLKVIGLSASRLGENEQAQEFLNLVLQLSSDQLERLAVRQELVGLQISAGHFSSAEKECREQLVVALKLKHELLACAIYTDLGISIFFQDRFDEATESFREALRGYELLNERTQTVNALNNIGNALSAKGDFAQAIEYWQRALQSSQEFGTLNQQAQIHNNLGIAHYNLKKFDKAKQCYRDAREKYKRIDSTIGLAFASTNLGEVMFAEGEYEAALNCWRESKGLYAGMDNAHAFVESCLHIANALYRLGDPNRMMEQLDEAENHIKKSSLDTFRARYNFMRGICHLRLGNLDRAEQFLETSRKIYTTDRAGESLWLASIRLAECYVSQGKHAEAVSLIESVLNDGASAKRLPIVAEADYVLGTIAVLKQELVPEKAIIYFKKGMDAIAKEPVSETTWKLTFALAREYYERGQRERAKEYLVKTKLILEFFLAHITSPELQKSYLAVDQKDRVFATIDKITKA